MHTRSLRLSPPPHALLAMMMTALLAVGCATKDELPPAPRTIGQAPASEEGSPSGPAPHRKVGNPYKVAGIWYYPKEDPTYDEVGIGSWYGPKFHGRKTANGELFDMNRLTAAHPTLPLPSTIKVTNLSNGRSIYVRLNDRGPFAHNRVVDLSRAAAEKIGYKEDGLAKVRVEYIGEASLADAITTLGAPAAYADGSYADVMRRPAVADMKMDTVKTRITSGPEIKTTGPIPSANELNTQMLADARASAARSESRVIESPLVVGKPVAIRTTSIPTETYQPPTASQPAPTPAFSPATPNEMTRPLFMVQVGAYSSLENAEKAVSRFSSDMPVRTARIETDVGRNLYRVRLGPYRTPALADEALANARATGFADARLVRP